MKIATSGADQLGKGGGNWMDKGGTYHFAVLDCKENMQQDGKPIKGGGFSVGLECIAGDHPDQVGRTVSMTFFLPKPDDGPEAISRRKITAAIVAFGLVSPAEIGSDVEVDITKAAGRQVVAVLDFYQPDKDNPAKKYLNLKFDDIWHVDDPRSHRCKKDEKALERIPSEARHGEAYFTPIVGGSDDGAVAVDSL